jgi:hypothetical protein
MGSVKALFYKKTGKVIDGQRKSDKSAHVYENIVKYCKILWRNINE